MSKINKIKTQDISSITNAMVDSDLKEVRRLQGTDFFNKVTVVENSSKSFSEKKHCDIIVLSVIDKEFNSLNSVFEFSHANYTDHTSVLPGGIRIFEKEILQERSSEKLDVLFAMIGAPGNVTSSIVSRIILDSIKPDLMILCGIAAGNIDKTFIYSGVLSNYIVYYEYQKVTTDGANPRLIPIQPKTRVKRDFSYMVSDNKLWKRKLLENFKKIEIDDTDFTKKNWINTNWRDEIRIDQGVIASGEKLIADGDTIKKLIDQIKVEKGIMAVEMEGNGFAQACNDQDPVDWMIVRGISDFSGEEKSDPVNDKYQIIAAMTASSITETYIKHYHLKRPEVF